MKDDEFGKARDLKKKAGDLDRELVPSLQRLLIHAGESALVIEALTGLLEREGP